MGLNLWIFIMLISSYSMNGFSAGSEPFNPKPYQIKIRSLERDLKEKRELFSTLDSKIKSCKKKPRGNFNCDGILNGNTTASEIDKWQDELSETYRTILKMERDLEAELSKSRVDGNGQIVIGNVKLEAKHLLMNAVMLKADLAGQVSDINSINASLDRTLIGEYTAYAIDQAIRGQKMKSLVCEAVANCAEMKKVSAKVNVLENQIKSFDVFRTEQLNINASNKKEAQPSTQ